MRLGLGLAALGLAAVLCLSGAAARDRIESEDRWATAVNTLKGKTRRLSGDDAYYYDDGDYDGNCPTQYSAWQDCIGGLYDAGTVDGTDDFFSGGDDGDEECDIETSGDLNSSPSGTTNHGAGKGWCYSALDDLVGCAASPGDCWTMCEDAYGDGLVAIDWEDGGDCFCQNECQCMEEVGDDESYLITRDSSVGALPHECGPGEGDYSYFYGCEPSNCDEATALVYEVCSSSQPTGPASACNAEYQAWQECEYVTPVSEDFGLTCDFTGACTSGPYNDGGTCAPTTAAPSTAAPSAAPSAAPTTSPAPTTAAPTTATPSAAPTITLKPTLQPTDKPTWELHASRGWRSGVLDILAKDEMHIAYTSNPMQSSAQCLHGNEMYLPARVLCDRQCMLDGAAVAKASGGTRAPPTPEECAGPWYCARTDVCELFRNPEHAPGSDAGFDRRCTTIWGCANHSMCFPTEDAAAGMHIDFRKEDLAIKRRSGDRPGHQARWVSDPMELRYGGFTVRTTCCANDHDFAVGVDMPCNGAARATAFVGLALLLWGLT